MRLRFIYKVNVSFFKIFFWKMAWKQVLSCISSRDLPDCATNRIEGVFTLVIQSNSTSFTLVNRYELCIALDQFNKYNEKNNLKRFTLVKTGATGLYWIGSMKNLLAGSLLSRLLRILPSQPKMAEFFYRSIRQKRLSEIIFHSF